MPAKGTGWGLPPCRHNQQENSLPPLTFPANPAALAPSPVQMLSPWRHSYYKKQLRHVTPVEFHDAA